MRDLFAQRICDLRNEKHLTQEQLADLIGVGKTTISNYEISYAHPSGKNLRRLAQALNVSTSYLLGETDLRERYAQYVDGTRIPVFDHLDLTALTQGTEADAESMIELPDAADLRDDDFFAIQMWDDSMAVDHIFKKDYVILRRCGEINNGRIYLVVADGLTYLRRVTQKDHMLTLIPNSEKRKYQPIQVSTRQSEIIGCAVKVVTNVF